MAQPTLHRVDAPWRGFALASDLMLVEPFASAPAAAVASGLRGQFARGHNLIALEGGRLAGYLGWGLASEAVARAYAETGYAPEPEDLIGGDWVVLMMVHAERPALLRRLIAELKTLYPGAPYVGLRYKGDRERGVMGRSLAA